MGKDKKEKILFILSIALIFILSLILFYKPLFSGQPLGLDTLGHLSKISYLKTYPFANWDMAWYSGTLFLKLYPPLFYYILALFPNTFFAVNFIWFFSILLSCLGIYFLIRYLTKDEKISIFCGISFLSVLSLSYYSISTGNLPYFSALFTIPFSLYYLEKSLKEHKKKDFIFYTIIFIIGILMHVIVGFLIGILMIIRFVFEGINFKNIKRMILYGTIPVFISSFWLIPFLVYSNSSEGYEGYIPKPMQLFGFKDNVAWGLQAGGIGVLVYLLILTMFLFKRYKKNKLIWYYLISLFLLGFLLFGGLGSHYPLGVDAVRFILPFSILLILYLGMVIYETKLFNSKLFLIGIFVILIVGIFWNLNVINTNFDKFSYYKGDSRYSIFKEIMNETNFPLKDNFTNYRFGTSKFVFGEIINYFMPSVSQTFGYQDAGMLNAPSYYDMRWHIYMSDDINGTLYYLDWFGIKYFEFEKSDFETKLNNNSRFKEIMNFSKGYKFSMYEYLDAKPIISLIEDLNSSNIGKIKEFKWERKNPDEIQINYNNISKDNVVLFKEFYHSSWTSKEIPSQRNLNIKKVGPGFMSVYPSEDSKGVIFYQRRTFFDYLGLLLTLIGVVILIYVLKKPNLFYHNNL